MELLYSLRLEKGSRLQRQNIKRTSRPRPGIIEVSHPTPNLTNCPFLCLPSALTTPVAGRTYSKVQAPTQLRCLNGCSIDVRRRIRSSNKAAGFLQQANASADVPLPASLSQSTVSTANRRLQLWTMRLTPSHQISKDPIAQYAKSSVAEPKLLTPCTMPPFPPRPPISVAKLTKLSTLRWRLPSGMSRRSLPHSQEKMQPLGAFSGKGGMGLCRRGRRWVSFSQAPLPVQAEKVCCRKGAFITPMVGMPLTTKPIETQ